MYSWFNPSGSLLHCGQRGEVDHVWRAPVVRLMRAAGVVEIEVGGQVKPCGADAVVALQVDVFVLHAAPQPLDEDVVAPAASAVHALVCTDALHFGDERGAAELAALIRVHDLRRTPTRYRLAQPMKGASISSRADGALRS